MIFHWFSWFSTWMTKFPENIQSSTLVLKPMFVLFQILVPLCHWILNSRPRPTIQISNLGAFQSYWFVLDALASINTQNSSKVASTWYLYCLKWCVFECGVNFSVKWSNITLLHQICHYFLKLIFDAWFVPSACYNNILYFF